MDRLERAAKRAVRMVGGCASGMRRGLALFMTGVLLFSSLPVQAFADPNGGEYLSVDEEELWQPGDEPLAENTAESSDEGASESVPADDQDGSASPDAAEESGTASSEEPEASATEGAPSAEAPAAPAASASASEDNGLMAVTLQGKATESKEAAVQALESEAGLDADRAAEAAANLFASASSPFGDKAASDGSDGDAPEDELPTEGDGSYVDVIKATWITEDTVENNDPDVLYVKPPSDSAQSVSLRVSYALSGEHDYEPGTVVITVPDSFFSDRDGKKIGEVKFAVPENPSTSGDWNYKLVGDTYIITNTRRLAAATQGYMEFAIDGLIPHELVDMMESPSAFWANIQVVTHQGNLIGDSSNELTAQFDTHAEVDHATKRQSGEVTRVRAEDIPEAQRIEGVEEYAVVTWYMNAYIPETVNQPYTLSLKDTKGDAYKGFILDERAVQGENGVDSSLDTTVFEGYAVRDSKYTTVKVAYPLDGQFEKGKTYTFENEVVYTLTEADPESGNNKQEVTSKSASARVNWKYEDPKFERPGGHFDMYKYGNSHVPYGSGMETIGRFETRSDLYCQNDEGSSASLLGYYGSYPSALNKLRDGKDVDISYTVNTVGYLLPWTYEKPENWDGEGNPEGVLENYGKRPVTMTTEDHGLSLNDTGSSAVYDKSLTLGKDWRYKSVEFPKVPSIRKAEAINLGEDGEVDFTAASDGTVDYVTDDDIRNVPQVILEVKRGDTWEKYATADWTSGALVITLADGNTQTDSTVVLPEYIEGVRTKVTAKNAAVLYHIRVNTTVLAGGQVGKLAAESFDGSSNPSLSVWNYATMTAEGYGKFGEGDYGTLTSISERGYDRLRGYTSDTRVLMSKSAEQAGEADSDKRAIPVTYGLKVRKQSFITGKDAYEEAVKEGEILPETSGTFYDLLPKGMIPKLDTVELRSEDAIREMYTIEDYQGSGRTLLVVKATLTPQLSTWEDDGVKYLEDELSLTFDAEYPYESYYDFGGEDLHNVAAYQSDNPVIGTVEGYQGEVSSQGNNNVGTKDAFEGDERDILSKLDPTCTTPSFVFAGKDVDLRMLEEATTGLKKDVMVNNDGRWSTGVYGGDPAANARDVYAGGSYSYRLGIVVKEGDQAKDVVIYDSLENYEPVTGNDEEDVGKPTWQGKLIGIDLSPLEAKGCAPKVYYSTKEGLKLEADGGEGIAPDEENTDLSNEDVWTLWDGKTELSALDVRAIAVDASKTIDGGDFVLDSRDRISVYLHMRAPRGEAAADLVGKAYAYNNVYMGSTTYAAGQPTTGEGHKDFIHQEYTKVGLVNYGIDVKKIWEDEDDHDGFRAAIESVAVHLYADGRPAEEVFPDLLTSGEATLTLTEENGWSGSFEMLPYLHDDGSKVIYSLKEDAIEGYAPDIVFDGTTFTLTNVHEPVKIDVAGTKTWVGDNEDVRPETIKVSLYADGEYVKSVTVRPDASGSWSYEFKDLYKYHKGGGEIVYTVQEEVDGSYIPSTDGTDLVNTYHPYGDLVIRKKVEGATEVNADKEFEFAVTFTREPKDEEGSDPVTEPVFDSFTYTVYDAGGAQVSTGSISTGGIIKLKDGQWARITEIPEDVHYAVKETEAPGFDSTAEGDTGVIAPNEEQTASFVNVYRASTRVSLGARKVLTGRELKGNQFQFELCEMVDGKEVVVRTATNDVPGKPSEDGTGDTVSSASVTFGSIPYTQADHGKTHVYTIREIISNKDGYTYDQTIYTAEVTLTDKGDGTMDAEVVYKDAKGNVIENPEEGVVFRNSYTASGLMVPRLSKDLKGGELKEGMFEFELLQLVMGDDDVVTSTVSKGIATNAADGSVTLPALEYTQRDIGKTYVYAMHEVAGDNELITYDEHWSLMQVEVEDNGDGTLSPVATYEDFTVDCWLCSGTTGEDGCPACGGAGKVTAKTDSYAFENAYVEGDLKIQKTVEDEGGNPNQKFKFRVELTNEDGEPLDVKTDDVKVSPIGGEPVEPATDDEEKSGVRDAGAAEEGAKSLVPSWLTDAIDFVTGLFAPGEAYAEEPAAKTGNSLPAEGDEVFWHWKISAEGELTVGGTISVSSPNSTKWPWNSYRDEITAVSFEAGTCFSEYSEAAYMFYSCGNLQTVDFSNLDMSAVESTESMFDDCEKLEVVDMSKVKESSEPTNMSEMFARCDALREVKFGENFDTSSVEDIGSLFNGCTSLVSVDLSHFNTESVLYASSAFEGCKSLKTLDLSDFNLSKAWNLSGFFAGCASLESLQLGDTFVTSACTDLGNFFNDCKSLKDFSVLASFDTSNVTDMGGMLYGCSLVEVPEEFYELNLASCEDLGSLFGSNYNLTHFDWKSLRAPKLNSMNGMFFNCHDLISVDLSQLKLSETTDMARLFQGCESLTDIKFPSNGLSVSSMRMMFQDCEKLERLDLSSLCNVHMGNDESPDFGSSTYDAFDGCRALKWVMLGDKFTLKSVDGSQKMLLPDPATGKGTWVKIGEDGKPAANSFTPEELASSYPELTGGAGTYVWDTWIPVTFDPNYETEDSPTVESVNTEEDFRVDVSLRRPGYILKGWAEEKNGNDWVCAPGETVSAGTWTKKKAVTLYAQWERAADVSSPSEGVLEIEMPAGYEALIPDLPSGTSYRVYEETPAGWTLVEQKNSSGVIKPGETQTASFVNKYTPGKTNAQIIAAKLLDGKPAAEGSFDFTLTETTTGVVDPHTEMVSVAAGGSVVFSPIEYTEEGTYTYEIKEVVPDSPDPSIDYDDQKMNVTVKVTKDSSGALKAAVHYGSSSVLPTFKNTTKPGSLSIHKVATGAMSASGNASFTFKVTIAGKPYAGAYSVGVHSKKTKDGTIALKGGETALIEGLPAGSSYTVEEIEIPDGWKLASIENESGVIASAGVATVTASNSYAATGDAWLTIYKKLEDGVLDDGEFTFELWEGDKLISTASNKALDDRPTIPGEDEDDGEVENPAYGKGAVDFPAISYGAEGQHTYTIKEVIPGDATQNGSGMWIKDGVVYDPTPIMATVDVKDTGSGTLKTTVKYEDNRDTFTNAMEKVDLEIQKTVTNEDLSDAASAAKFTFTVELKDAAGKSLQNCAYKVYEMEGSDGEAISLGKISDGGGLILKADQRAVISDLPYGGSYTVTEGELPGWKQEAGQTTGASGMLEGDAVAHFVNTYTASGQAVFMATKKLDGNDPGKHRFTFGLRDVTEGSPSEGTVIMEAENDASGNVEFEPISYTEADAGKTFSYEIFETEDPSQDVSYDDTVVKAQVKVADEGDGTLDVAVTYDGDSQPPTFENWLRVMLARTGGPGLAVVSAVGVGAMATGALWLVRRRRHR